MILRTIAFFNPGYIAVRDRDALYSILFSYPSPDIPKGLKPLVGRLRGQERYSRFDTRFSITAGD